jgi:pimeloyl-ACP methyl ester carboxylesterase
MADGTSIDAALSTPRNLAPGQTTPVVIMPAPLSPLGCNSYPGMFPRWALGGYTVLAYSQRGLADSAGEIQVAGPLDWSDGTEIINWVTGLESTDPDRIGCFGASCGAGTSLLLAAHDQRVKAVAGASAWADLFLSLYENGTRHILAFEEPVKLFGEDRCSKEFRGIIEKVRASPEPGDDVRKFARDRSPATVLRVAGPGGECLHRQQVLGRGSEHAKTGMVKHPRRSRSAGKHPQDPPGSAAVTARSRGLDRVFSRQRMSKSASAAMRVASLAMVIGWYSTTTE